MSEKENKEIFRRVIEEGYSKGHLDMLDEVFAPDFVEHQAGIVPSTVDGVKGSIPFLRAAFPDLRLTIEEIIASGDKTWSALPPVARIKGRSMACRRQASRLRSPSWMSAALRTAKSSSTGAWQTNWP